MQPQPRVSMLKPMLFLLLGALPASADPLVEWESHGGPGPLRGVYSFFSVEEDGSFSSSCQVHGDVENSRSGLRKSHLKKSELQSLKQGLARLDPSKLKMDAGRPRPGPPDGEVKTMKLWRNHKASIIPLWQVEGAETLPAVLEVEKLCKKYLYIPSRRAEDRP